MDIVERIKNEPVLITTIVGSLAVILVQFGIPIDDGAANAISGLIVAVATLLARSQVTPTNKLPNIAAPVRDDGNLL